MSFIESCATSVHAIEGYQTIYYRSYRQVEPKYNAGGSGPIPRSSECLQVFRAAEDTASMIRSKNGLASVSHESVVLWVFGRSAASFSAILPRNLDHSYPNGNHDNDGSDSISIGNSVWKCTRSGDITVSRLLEVCEASNRPQNSTSGNSSTSKNGGAFDPVVTPTATENDSSNAEDEATNFIEAMHLFKVYRAYKSAWISLIGLCMRRRLAMVPLDILTYSIGSSSWEMSSNFSDLSGKYRQSYLIDLNILQDGTILTSLLPEATPSILDRNSTLSRQVNSRKSTQNVLIGPYGKYAMAVFPPTRRDDTDGTFSKGASSLRIPSVAEWRLKVQALLVLRGVYLYALDKDDSWMLVSLVIPSQFMHRNSNDEKMWPEWYKVTFSWPREICFQHEPFIRKELVEARYETRESVTPKPSFRPPKHGLENGYPNIGIDFALKALEMDVDSLLPTQKETHDTLETSQELSRLSSDSQAGEDSLENQAIDMIYPTPPDLLPSQTSPENHYDQGLSSRTSYNASSVQVPSQEIVNDLVQESDPHSEAVGKDSYMHDSDDDLFGPEGISDPDFSFFDEPSRENPDSMEIDSVPALPALEVPKDSQRTSEVTKIEPVERILASEGMQVLSKGAETEKLDTPTRAERTTTPQKSLNSEANWNSTPPLSPEAVKQQLSSTALASPRSSNLLESIPFNADLGLADQKYLNKGKFGAEKWHFRKRSNESNFQKNQSLWAKSSSSPKPKLKSEVNVETSPSVPKPHSATSSDDDSDEGSSSVNDYQREATFQARRKYQVLSGADTKSSRSAHKDVSDEASPSRMLTDMDLNHQEDFKEPELSEIQVEYLLNYLFDPRPDNNYQKYQHIFEEDDSGGQDYFPPSSDDYELIEIAQIVAEQFAFSTADTYPVLSPHPSSLLCRDAEVKNFDFPELEALIEEEFAPARKLDLFSYITSKTDPRLDLADPDESHFSKAKEKPFRKIAMTTSLDAEDRLMKLHSQHVRLRRTESLWDFLPTATAFWEVLGLGPTSDTKRVLAYCIFPSEGPGGATNEVTNEGNNEEFAKHFLKTMASLWNTFKLGSHLVEEDSKKYAGGLARYDRASDSLPLTDLTKIEEVCCSLGEYLANKNPEVDAVIIYIINHSTDPNMLQSFCSCFNALRQSYLQSTQHMTHRLAAENVVLKLIPSTLLEGADGLGSLSPEVGFKLAREVYDRCPPANRQNADEGAFMPSYSSIELAETSPKAVFFYLTPGEAQNFWYEAPCLHVSYSESASKGWISAAWTDNIGKNQALRSYCCSGNCTFDDIAGEIWSTTLDILKARNYKWRVFISKAEPLSRAEKGKWIRMIESSKSTTAETVTFEVTIISLNTKPNLSIRKNYRQGKNGFDLKSTEFESDSKAAGQKQSTASAASTANQPSLSKSSSSPSSPSPSAAPAGTTTSSSVNPIEAYNAIDEDPKARLIDLADEAWGIVLSQARNVFSGTANSHAHMAMFSGHLLKRISANDYDPLAVLEVNIMYDSALAQEDDKRQGSSSGGGDIAAAARQRRSERLLREVLVMYRGLALLARLRGIEQVHSVRPWHVAVAMKSAEALGKFMRI